MKPIIKNLVLAACLTSAAFLYCLLHSILVPEEAFNIHWSLLWVTSYWGIWLFLALALYVLDTPSFVKGAMPKQVFLMGFSVLFVTAWSWLLDPSKASFAVHLYKALPYAVGCYCIFWFINRDKLTTEKTDTPSPAIKVLKGQLEVSLPTKDIIWVKASANYVELYTTEDAYLLRTTLGSLKQQPGFEDFAQIHRSYAARKSAILGLLSGKNTRAKLITGTLLPVGPSYKKAFKAQLFNT